VAAPAGADDLLAVGREGGRQALVVRKAAEVGQHPAGGDVEQGRPLMARRSDEELAVGREGGAHAAAIVEGRLVALVHGAQRALFGLAHRRRQQVVGRPRLRRARHDDGGDAGQE